MRSQCGRNAGAMGSYAKEKEKEKEKKKKKKSTPKKTSSPSTPSTPWSGVIEGTSTSKEVRTKTSTTRKKPVRKKKTKKAPVVTEELREWFYREFWPHYPLHVAEEKALRAAARRIPKDERGVVVAALHDQLTWPADLTFGLNPKRSHLPNPETWIQDKRWKDEGPKEDPHRNEILKRLKETKRQAEKEDRSGW